MTLDHYKDGKAALAQLVAHSDKGWESEPRHQVMPHLQTLGVRRMTRDGVAAACDDRAQRICITENNPVVLQVPEPDDDMLITLCADWHFASGQRTLRLHLWKIDEGDLAHVSMHMDGANPAVKGKPAFDFAHLQLTARHPPGSIFQPFDILENWAPNELPRIPVIGQRFAGLLTSLACSLYGRSEQVSKLLRKHAEGEKPLLGSL